MKRRDFLAASTAASYAAASGVLPLGAAETVAPRGHADHVVMIWLGGGMAQIDTFDPKRQSTDGLKDPGSAYASIPTAAAGVEVCEHLPRLADRMDRVAPIRTLHHDIIDEHAAASYHMHIGRPVSGTVVYPTLGAMIAHLKGPAGEDSPPYVLMGTPSPGRSPGFLGAENGYLLLPNATRGPKGLTRPQRISDERAARRQAMLARLRRDHLDRTGGDERIADYATAQAKGFDLAGPEFMATFDLDNEPADTREAYGGEFGQRCLLARRLVERGSRFVEVSFNIGFQNGTGWDTHREGQKLQHVLIDQLDRAVAALLDDLQARHLLDRTLVMISTEFGRPAKFDAQGGRGHHGKCFTCVLAGGGLKTGQAIGQTDELAQAVVGRPVTVPDLFATVLAACGCDPHEELYAGSRPVPATDGGMPIGELFG